MDNDLKQKKVGLALSGGFIRAAAQIGVIEVLQENNIPIDIVSGCSSGAAIAACYANNTLDQIKKRLSEGRRRDYWKVIFEPTFPIKGLLKGERNRKFFEEFVGDKNFSDLDKKLILTATDLRNMEEVIIEEGPISKAIQACTAVPGFFIPVEWEEKILADGCNFNLIPSRSLYKNGAEYVIAIYVSQQPSLITRFVSMIKKMIRNQNNFSRRSNRAGWLNIFQSIKRAASLSSSFVDNFYHHSYPYDILIKPQVSNVKRWHVSMVDYCIEAGRKAAEEQIPQIKKDLGL